MNQSGRQIKSREQRRAERFHARSILWRESRLPRVRACGLHHAPTGHDAKGKSVQSAPVVTLLRTRRPDGAPIAGVAGVQSCGSVWACPVCAEKVQAVRAGEVSAALASAVEQGYEVTFATFTVRHHARQSLSTVWETVSQAWRGTFGCSRGWKDEKDLYDVQGYVRLLEVTHGANGWHVHIHSLLVHRPLSHGEFTGLTAGLVSRWRKSVPAEFRPSARHGVDIRKVTKPEDLGDYFQKSVYRPSDVSREVTQSHSKRAKAGNVTPFGILERLVRDGDEADLDLWHEWERVSKGRRQLIFSKGLRAKLLAEHDEKTDEQIAAEGPGNAEAVAELFPKSWRRVCHAGAVPAVLDALEVDDDGQTLRSLLDRLGITAADWPRLHPLVA